MPRCHQIEVTTTGQDPRDGLSEINIFTTGIQFAHWGTEDLGMVIALLPESGPRPCVAAAAQRPYAMATLLEARRPAPAPLHMPISTIRMNPTLTTSVDPVRTDYPVARHRPR